ncbi:hypothetical protein [Sediminicola sp. 1XM1-17]|uniref:hypothetical protein n=1 Tax=Sediminicola sp. 1XM1-17 TaxID=3127702 RepID=UPI0030772C3F
MIKKNIFYLLLLYVLSISCSNDDDNSNQVINVDIPLGSIVAEIDGIERTFNIDSKAKLDTIPWIYQSTAVKLSISGKLENSSNSENILIWFFAFPVREIDQGTYPDLNKQIYQYLEYNSSWQDDLYNYQANGSGIEEYQSESTIIRIDSEVQGIFNGKVIIGAGAIGEEQPPLDFEIRNGKFNLTLE